MQFKITSDYTTRNKSVNDLMNHLRDIMVGYETEEVLALLKEMEGLMSGAIWNFLCEDGVPYWLIDDRDWGDELRTRMDKMIIICEQLCNIKYNSDVVDEEAVVGFDNEAETLLDQLTGNSTKQFQIISITGMVGPGKTTLARTLYNHELVKYMFDFRARTCVSQVYIKKDLLLNILRSFVDEFYQMSEQQLGEKLYRKLKSRKDLVIFDDIWDCSVWNDLKMYFPDDKTGSRVLFTRRDIDVSLHLMSARPVHILRLRTEVESLSIFKKKVFRMGILPYGLEESGLVINKKYEGLQLAIVIAAGLLKNNLSVTWWDQIAASLHSVMVSDPNVTAGFLNKRIIRSY